MRATDVLLSIPPLPLILLLSGLVRPSVPALILIIGALGWMSTARIVRSEFLSLREREFVQSARAIGSTNARLIWLHILPQLDRAADRCDNSRGRTFDFGGIGVVVLGLRRSSADTQLGQPLERGAPMARQRTVAGDPAGDHDLRHDACGEFRRRRVAGRARFQELALEISPLPRQWAGAVAKAQAADSRFMASKAAFIVGWPYEMSRSWKSRSLPVHAARASRIAS